jgi:type I restriction enzyme S subunit
MSFPRYPHYKASGAEWLEQVPAHWKIKAIGAISSLKGRLGWQGLKADEYRDDGPYVVSSAHFLERRIMWDQCPRVSQQRYETDTNIQLAVGDVLLMKDGAAMGKLAFIDSIPGAACLNSHLLLFRPVPNLGIPSYHPKFMLYFMQTSLFQEHIKVHGTGATFLGVSQETIARYRIALPTLDEQASIIAFLDRETGKIDALVEEQRRLIDLLKEKRQAAISHAVTKGLDPNTKMKPSGVEWLGEVAEHWEVLPLKRCFASVDYGISNSLEPDGSVAVLRMGNIQDGKVVVDDLKYVDQVDADLLLRADDLLYNRTNSLDLIGKVGRFLGSDAPTTFASYLVRLRTSKSYDPRFLSYLLNTASILGTARSRAFVAIGQCNLNPTRYGEIVVACPDLAEQQAIATVLDRQVERVDQLIIDAGKAIDLLSERRAGLISAAVTGKIDVREVATEREAAA